jgi:hypothetical protein
MPRETMKNHQIVAASTAKSRCYRVEAVLGLTGIVQIPFPYAVWSVEEGYGYSIHTV